MENEDHRSLGRRLRLFDTVPIIGAGLPIWLPDGAVIRGELERMAAEIAERTGCVRVHTPVLAKRALFEQSGHWNKFAEDMFPAMKVGDDELVLRPANCPSHVQVYAAEAHSWRDLPVRLIESASMFRSELSGVLGGLSRVRQISLDDAHVFCAEDQVVDEVVQALDAITDAYGVLGITVDHYRLSGRGPGSGADQDWDASEADLRAALDRRGIPFEYVPGEGAFYGPKIDVQVRDSAGREETLSTVQVDRVLPERFGLSYIGVDGAKHRPVMIHRGLLSSMERLVALLIEQYQGGSRPGSPPCRSRSCPSIHAGMRMPRSWSARVWLRPASAFGSSTGAPSDLALLARMLFRRRMSASSAIARPPPGTWL
ncbi:threonine--tRNA ligase [Microbacterium sp. KUDC0406]|nr:aminoacyl--tRNA ligase-related protein [Microbacterium sp. KUDC0406]UJP10772.1 threonine--tRNA ligase [Microbacterium sp. KUDC0406]